MLYSCCQGGGKPSGRFQDHNRHIKMLYHDGCCVRVTCPSAGPSYLKENLGDQDLRVCSNFSQRQTKGVTFSHLLFMMKGYPDLLGCLLGSKMNISRQGCSKELHPKLTSTQGTIWSSPNKSSGSWMPSSVWSLSRHGLMFSGAV